MNKISIELNFFNFWDNVFVSQQIDFIVYRSLFNCAWNFFLLQILSIFFSLLWLSINSICCLFVLSLFCRLNRITWSSLFLVIVLVPLARAQFHPSQFRSQAVSNNGFIPSVQDEEKTEDSTPSAAINYRQSAYEYDEDEVIFDVIKLKYRRR